VEPPAIRAPVLPEGHQEGAVDWGTDRLRIAAPSQGNRAPFEAVIDLPHQPFGKLPDLRDDQPLIVSGVLALNSLSPAEAV